jgi:GNAT superfamily N-acetyltransferase
MSATVDVRVRDWLRDDDVEGIVELHRIVYQPEYGMNEAFLDRVAEGVLAARSRGWPERAGAVRLVDRDERLSGCVALTEEGEGIGRIRWVVLLPELRGAGLGRLLIGELVDEARDAGWHTLQLETFSALRSAARIYRDLGFRVVSERVRQDWGPPVVYQHYEMALG